MYRYAPLAGQPLSLIGAPSLISANADALIAGIVDEWGAMPGLWLAEDVVYSGSNMTSWPNDASNPGGRTLVNVTPASAPKALASGTTNLTNEVDFSPNEGVADAADDDMSSLQTGTVFVFVKLNTNSGTDYFLGRGTTTVANRQLLFGIDASGRPLVFLSRDGSSSSNYTSAAGYIVPTGSWVSVCYVQSGTGMYAIINGSYVVPLTFAASGNNLEGDWFADLDTFGTAGWMLGARVDTDNLTSAFGMDGSMAAAGVFGNGVVFGVPDAKKLDNFLRASLEETIGKAVPTTS